MHPALSCTVALVIASAFVTASGLLSGSDGQRRSAKCICAQDVHVRSQAHLQTEQDARPWRAQQLSEHQLLEVDCVLCVILLQT